METLSDEDKKLLHVEDSNIVFKFGDSKLIKSNKKVTIPTVIADQKVMLTTDVISNDLPLFLSKEAMKRANTQIDFASDKINILGRDVQVFFSTSGHYCIPIGTLNSSGMGSTEEIKEVNLFCKELSEKTVSQKQRIAEKLHRQFSHAKSDKLKVLLRDTEVMDKSLKDLLDRLDDSCSICKKYRRPKPRPVAGSLWQKRLTKQLVWISRSGHHTLQKYGFCILLTAQHVIVHHVSYTPKEKKKLLKRSFRYGYLFLVLLKSFSSTMEESSIMMNLGLYVKMLI